MRMNKSVKLFFAGDFCSNSSTSIIKVSEELRSIIASCDIRFVNFEVPLKPEGVTLPPQSRERFFQNDDAPAFLKELGFNLFSLANNHAFDWGDEGFLKTREALGDDTFGAGLYNDAYKVKIVNVNGVKIGFLAACFAAYTGVFSDVDRHEGLGCAYVNDLRLNHDIIQAKKEVDYLFIIPHDGIEYIDIPLPETIARYRDFIDYGADGVIGMHTHCPQGWEEYRGKPIFYSLGNFLFNSKEGYDYRATNRPHWYEGLCVIMTIEDEKLSWEVMNTRNVDNIAIDIDDSKSRQKHNEKICTYLVNKAEYQQYLSTLCVTIGQKELSIVDRTFHSYSLKECTKLLLKGWMNKLKGKDFTNVNSLQRLLAHDARRQLLMWTIKTYKNHQSCSEK